MIPNLYLWYNDPNIRRSVYEFITASMERFYTENVKQGRLKGEQVLGAKIIMQYYLEQLKKDLQIE